MRFESPESQARLEEEIAQIEADYAALPADSSRSDALKQLRWRTESVIAEQDELYMRELDFTLSDYKNGFIGTWSAEGITLVITPEFSVDYEKRSGSSSSSVSAPIQRFERDQFQVGMFGINTTFVIDEPPHIDDSGAWWMTLDGVALTRTRP